jgi:hypothetical protein
VSGGGRPARAHHLVSRFYLRHFANDQDQITTIRLPGDRVFTQSVNRASVENDYYTAIGNDGQETDAAERAFNEIEGPASEAWRLVADGTWPLPPAQREIVAGWIALHLLRGARSRVAMNNIGTDLLNLEIIAGGTARLRNALRDIGEPYDDESVANEWVSLFENPLEVQVNANHHLNHVVRALPHVTQSLLDRWWVLTSFTRKSLATCDQPVHVMPNPRDVARGLGTGIETADEIHVPLTRRISLGMVRRDALPSGLDRASADVRCAGVAKVALYCNSCTINSAWRMIFHHPDDQPLIGLELHPPRSREVGSDGDLWRFMPPADRQLLLDSGLAPPGGRAEL